MSLRRLAEQDLGPILEDGVYGFGWDITLTSPTGAESTLTGFSNDISELIDPGTGQAVSGRLASVTLRIASIFASGFSELPRHIEDVIQKPWRVTFEDINGRAYTFKVAESNPDRALGVVSLILEFYQ